MSDPLPPPLVPATIDLRNFPDMPLEVARVRDSDLRRRSSGEEFKAAILLWCAAWHQVPAGSLPHDDVELSDLAAYGTAKGAVRLFLKVKAMAMRGWIHCADGRWYHPRLASKVMMAWKAKQLQRERTYKARLASLVKAMEKETDPKRRGVLQAEHDKLLVEMSHALSQGTSQPPREGIGSEGKGSEGIGRDNSLSSSPPSPSAPAKESATGDDGAKAVPMDNLIRPEEAKPVEKPLSRKAQGMNAAALRLAIRGGSVHTLVKVFGCPVDGDLATEWNRDTDGVTIGEIAAVLAWRKALKDPVRMPSGFRAAMVTWRELKIETRRHLAAVHLGALGVEHGIKTEGEPT